MLSAGRIWLGKVLKVAAIVLAGLLAGWVFRHEPAETQDRTERAGPRENRLAKESSPYLQLHKHNPIDWYPWGSEALERARREQRPIFLSIGYSACYWCHVMERESFNDPEIAKTLNDHFVCIKVDREELPDVDEVFMNFLLLQTGRGGWPLTVFLTPEAKPVAGGTYFPPKSRNGLPGLDETLAKFLTAWNENREEFEANAARWTQALQRTGAPRSFTLQKLNRSVISKAVQELAATFDPEFGGFGYDRRRPRLPKFPQPCTLQLLAYQAARESDSQAENMLRLTLDRMAQGGIRDHLGNGFHRYSVDRFWQVPHFEKMLYDNALLAQVYLETYALTQERSHLNVATRIFDFVDRELTSPDGGFYSAIDAESEHEEGKFYAWTRDEIRAVLDPGEYEWFAAVHGLQNPPNFDGKYVLYLTDSLPNIAQRTGVAPGNLAGVLERAASKLLAVRANRPRPLLDTKILTDWNGLMITALAEGYRLVGDANFLTRAERAANLILTRSRPAGSRLQHVRSDDVARVPGYLEDYAFFIESLLALHRVTGQDRWLGEARGLADEMISLFWDESSGGFFRTGSDQGVVLVRLKPTRDSAVPSGNSVALRCLVVLAERTNSRHYGEIAGKTLQAFAGSLTHAPSEWPCLVRGLGEYLDANLQGEYLASKSPGPDLKVVRGEVVPPRMRLSPAQDFQFAVRIEIDPEWHIYANPSTRPEFPPTVLEVKSNLPLSGGKVEYPQARAFQAQGAKESIEVYSGTKVIKFSGLLRPDAPLGQSGFDLILRYQSCNDQRCLAPQTIELHLPVEVVQPPTADR